MDGPDLGPLPRFSTIGLAEKINLHKSLSVPLSGMIGGSDDAGYFVSKLQNEWQDRFHVAHAIACNSATSGLLAACMAIGIKPGDTVWCPAYTMSATAACAKALGARIVFIDIETNRFSMNMNHFGGRELPKCVIVTNLFGHPAYLSTIRSWCDSNNVWMIEDNAQSPLATENGRYAGTIGHIGVFSLNVHKHIQTGEGGVVVTDDSFLAHEIRRAINHGELGTRADSAVHVVRCGLNLRMTEPIAAIACAQLAKAENIVRSRIDLANELTEMVFGIPWIVPPLEGYGCRHVYYVWAARIVGRSRERFVENLQKCGFPIREGYSTPLNYLFDEGFEQPCPVAYKLEAEEIITFEICAWAPKKHHLRKMKDIILWSAERT